MLVEPLLTLAAAEPGSGPAGYALLVLLVAGLRADRAGRRGRGGAGGGRRRRRRWRRLLHWIVLAAVPSGLMLSTTTHLTTDIVAMPLLWVLPLGLYLLSFVIAFADAAAAGRPHHRASRRSSSSSPAASPSAAAPSNPFFTATLGLLLLLVVAVALHAEMYRLRPAVGHLTAFYLAMSVGGVLGGLFCAIVAPTPVRLGL